MAEPGRLRGIQLFGVAQIWGKTSAGIFILAPGTAEVYTDLCRLQAGIHIRKPENFRG
jgi:hypothetical protein